MSVKWAGLNELKKRLDPSKAEAKAQRAVNESAKRLRMTMMQNAVFTHGYSLGETQGSIHTVTEKLSATVGPETEYSGYLEYGTRIMDAQPFVKPSLEKVAPFFIKALEKELKS